MSDDPIQPEFFSPVNFSTSQDRADSAALKYPFSVTESSSEGEAPSPPTEKQTATDIPNKDAFFGCASAANHPAFVASSSRLKIEVAQSHKRHSRSRGVTKNQIFACCRVLELRKVKLTSAAISAELGIGSNAKIGKCLDLWRAVRTAEASVEVVDYDTCNGCDERFASSHLRGREASDWCLLNNCNTPAPDFLCLDRDEADRLKLIIHNLRKSCSILQEKVVELNDDLLIPILERLQKDGAIAICEENCAELSDQNVRLNEKALVDEAAIARMQAEIDRLIGSTAAGAGCSQLPPAMW